MTLSPQWLDELRGRTVLSTLIGKSIKVTRAGREHKSCCPFHNEKTPSFTINDDKGFYHCFGCGAHGDAIRWMTEQRGLPFIDAVKELAGAAGMEVPEASPEAAAKAARIEGVRPALEAAQGAFVGALATTPRVTAGLAQRGITADLSAAFGIGYARGDGGLAGLRITRATGIAAGLFFERGADDGRGGSVGARFSDRIMVPIHDRRGRIISFGGRVADGNASAAKYINGAGSELFDKGRVLFNHHRAAAAYASEKRVLVVEGYFDVIALAGAGFACVVAPMGTALTPAQLALLWQMSPCPIICFDGDAAGKKAVLRAAETALPMIGGISGQTLSFAAMPDGRDPDDVVRVDGAAALEALLGAAQPLHRVVFDQVVADGWRHPAPEQAAAVWARLDQYARTIEDGETRAQYLAAWRARFEEEVCLTGELSGERVGAVPTISSEDEVDDRAVLEAALAEHLEELEASETGGGHVESGEHDGAVRRLRAIIDRALALRDERRGITADLAALMAAAAALGFDKVQIGNVLRMIEADPAAREDGEAVLVSYRRALGIKGPLTEAMLPSIIDARGPRTISAATKRASAQAALIDAREFTPEPPQMAVSHG